MSCAKSIACLGGMKLKIIMPFLDRFHSNFADVHHMGQ